MTKTKATIIAIIIAALLVTLGALFGGPNNNGSRAQAATLTAATALTGNQWSCSHTTPEWMLHAGNAEVLPVANSYKFTANHEGADFNGVYDTIGYEASLNSGWYCNHHKTWMPVKFGKLGNPVLSAHWVTSSNFQGDVGPDIWLTTSAADNTYTKMTTGGHNTELMIWYSRPDWAAWSHDARWKVNISGRTWFVVAGKVGHNGGWERVFMVPDGSHNGNVTVSNMRLDPFFTFLINHKLVNSQSDVLEAMDIGGEISHGSFALTGLALKGLTGE